MLQLPHFAHTSVVKFIKVHKDKKSILISANYSFIFAKLLIMNNTLNICLAFHTVEHEAYTYWMMEKKLVDRNEKILNINP